MAHDHGHMNEEELTPEVVEGFDSGNKSLAEALRMSFGILKIIMVVLILLYLASGVFTVEKDERAIVLWFGKAKVQADGGRLIGPGLHWTAPFPIAEIIKIPATSTNKISIDSFWYYETEQEKLNKKKTRFPRTLNPVQDGYCLTRGESSDGGSSMDYNIVHSKWQINYSIKSDPYAFFKNIYVETAAPGELMSDVINRSIKPLLSSMAEDAIVTVMVNYTIDQAITNEKTAISKQAKKLLQSKLDSIDSGIQVEDMQILAMTWPGQVDDAFQQSIIASQQKKASIIDAESYRDKTINEAQGPAQEKVSQAKAYRTRVVESAKANYEYLKNILPEYQQRPELVIQKIYQDAVEEVLDNAEEKIIVQPASGDKQREFRILINRDPAAKKAQKGEQK